MTIAKFLNDRIYNQFLTCCTNHKFYWIGFRQDLSHSSNKIESFRWEKSRKCRSKLSYIPQQQNNDGCMAVFIELRKPNSTNVIQATLANCSQRLGYICQRNNNMTNQATLNNSRLDGALSVCKSLNKKTTDYPLLKKTNFNDYKDIAIGGSIALIILVILFGFVYKCYSKKSNSAKAKTNANSLSKQQMKSSNTAETTHDFSPSNYAFQFFSKIEYSALQRVNESHTSVEKIRNEMNSNIYNQVKSVEESNIYEVCIQENSKKDQSQEENDPLQNFNSQVEKHISKQNCTDNINSDKDQSVEIANILYNSYNHTLKDRHQFNKENDNEREKDDHQLEEMSNSICHSHKAIEENKFEKTNTSYFTAYKSA